MNCLETQFEIEKNKKKEERLAEVHLDFNLKIWLTFFIRIRLSFLKTK